MRTRISATVLATAVVASLGFMMTRTTAQLALPVEPIPAPFTLTVGKHYEIYMPIGVPGRPKARPSSS